MLAGVIASVVSIAYCISFAALLFQGPLRDGLPYGLWALLVGTAVTAGYIGLKTAFVPADAGPDNPAVAVMSVLAGTLSGSLLAQGVPAQAASVNVLMAFSLATLVTGLVVYGIGAVRLGQLVRFVPYPVIAGFLAASGWLLIAGAVEVVTGREATLSNGFEGLAPGDVLRLGVAFLFGVGVLAMRRMTGSVFVLPTVFFIASVGIGLILWPFGWGEGWYLGGSNALKPWLPLPALASPDIHWWAILATAAEVGAVAGVTVIALLLDVSSLEVARGRSVDLDKEFRINGLANVIVAPIGGFIGNLSMNASRLLDETGGTTRLSPLVAALVIAIVVTTGIDLTKFIPAPVLGGLLIFLGLTVILETFLRSPAQKSWTELALAVLIMVAIVQSGYLTGVVFGFVGACLMFALNYSRIGVIRRHMTRAAFASNISRASDLEARLRAEGDRIHVFWLSGYIFFGSSNRLFESVREVLAGSDRRRPAFVILDFTGVSGLDTSAILSLVKLRNYCDEHDVMLAYASVDPAILLSLEHGELFGSGQRHRAFASRSEALEWCENRVLADGADGGETMDVEAFARWLERELGSEAANVLLDGYLQRHDYSGGETIYEQFGDARTLDFVAEGTIGIVVKDSASDRHLTLRRMTNRTVVGEMGFFRGTPRTATVVAEGPATVFVLTRECYDMLLREHPIAAARLHEFIIRILADRIEFANQEIASLG